MRSAVHCAPVIAGLMADITASDREGRGDRDGRTGRGVKLMNLQLGYGQINSTRVFMTQTNYSVYSRLLNAVA